MHQEIGVTDANLRPFAFNTRPTTYKRTFRGFPVGSRLCFRVRPWANFPKGWCAALARKRHRVLFPLGVTGKLVFYARDAMHKTALLFAGQGAQGVGMGKDLAEKFPTAKALFERANQILGYDLANICFHGPEAELTKTENAQPGIYLVSWIAFQLLKQQAPLSFQATAGLSLGEFTALAAAGVMSFEDGLKTVRARGRFMQEACEVTRGTMAAIIGLDEAPTREVCEQSGAELANL